MVISDGPIVPFDCIEKMIEQKKFICQIEMVTKDTVEKETSKGFGSGFFAYIRYQGQEYPVLITCDFILKKEYLNEINLKVGKDNKPIKIKVKDNRTIYSKKMREGGITIIEIIPKKDKIYNFFSLMISNILKIKKRYIFLNIHVVNYLYLMVILKNYMILIMQ